MLKKIVIIFLTFVFLVLVKRELPYFLFKTVLIEKKEWAKQWLKIDSDFAKKCFEEIDRDYLIDINSYFHIQKREDIFRLRKDLNDLIYGDKNVTKVTLENQNELKIDMGRGYVSYAEIFSPKNDNAKLVVFHQGHGDLKKYGGEELIKALLDNGYTVLGLTMPLYGNNTGPVSSHDEMPGNDNNYLRYFFEPIVRSIDYMKKNYDFSDIYMIGFSGGGDGR